MKPVIVFDLDDTLYLERDYVRSGFHAVGAWALREFALGDVAAVAWRLFLDGVRRTTITDAFARLGRPLDDAETAVAVHVYRTHPPQIALCPDADDALHGLSGVHTAIITDGPAASQRAKIEVLGLDDRVDEIVVTDERAGWAKPASHAFSFIEERFATRPDECTYVADNPLKDFAAPARLGWSMIRIARPGALHATLGMPAGLSDRVPIVTDLESICRENCRP